jgi:ectoine hydroxylase-related dioxygenase (phytanoyl-CoA dioxygenase family)
MTAFTHEVRPLFAEPLFRATISGAFSAEQIAWLQGLEMVHHSGNYISNNLYVLEQPEMRSAKAAIQEVLDLYARDVMCIPQRLHVTQSWALMQNPNASMQGHSYPNSVLSGLVYYDVLQAPGPNVLFSRHDTYQQIELVPDSDKRNVFNVPTTRVALKQNDVMLFSSRLTHLVEANRTGQVRCSLAFNTFVKGKLGSYREMSELTL